MTELRKQARKNTILFLGWLSIVVTLAAFYVISALAHGYVNNLEAWVFYGMEFIMVLALVLYRIYGDKYPVMAIIKYQKCKEKAVYLKYAHHVDTTGCF